MYHLTLTSAERRALDWIGTRYSNGEDLFRLLWGCENDTPGADWDHEGPITFHVPEQVAWQIAENAREEGGFWPCFADDLAAKLQAFCDAIV